MGLLKRNGLVGLLIIAAFLLISANAFAAPEWRGGNGTTFQQWSFVNDNPTPSPDDGWINSEILACLINVHGGK
jgi:hypothetical protein